MPRPFQITVDSPADAGEGLVLLRLAGDLDGSGSESLERHVVELAAPPIKVILLCMDQVDTMGNVVLGMFLGLLSDLKRCGIQVVFVGLKEPHLRLLELAGLSDRITICQTEVEALSKWRTI